MPAGIDLYDGSWHNVKATFDGATRSTYVDGVLAGSPQAGTRPTGAFSVNSDGYCVGKAAKVDNELKYAGTMRNLRVWSSGSAFPEATALLSPSNLVPTCEPYVGEVVKDKVPLVLEVEMCAAGSVADVSAAVLAPVLASGVLLAPYRLALMFLVPAYP